MIGCTRKGVRALESKKRGFGFLFDGKLRMQAVNIVVLLLVVALSIVMLFCSMKTAEIYAANPMGTVPPPQVQRDLDALLNTQRIVSVAILVISLGYGCLVAFMMILPLNAFRDKIAKSEPLPVKGSEELQDLAESYNEMYEENRRTSEHLKHVAEHDSLTRLYNRWAFESFREQFTEDVALLLLDVDGFKGFNDVYGHDVGDRVLQKVAKLMKHCFRFSDYPCRIGGDEFAIIMTGMTAQLKAVVVNKIAMLRRELMDTSDGLPPITLSVGIAFSSATGEDDLFKAADRALYFVKEKGKNGYAFNLNGVIE